MCRNAPTNKTIVSERSSIMEPWRIPIFHKYKYIHTCVYICMCETQSLSRTRCGAIPPKDKTTSLTEVLLNSSKNIQFDQKLITTETNEVSCERRLCCICGPIPFTKEANRYIIFSYL